MKDVQGKCRFCGQYQMLSVPDSFNDVDIEDEATKKCDCAEAQADTKIKENIANTEGAIKDFFKDFFCYRTVDSSGISKVNKLCKVLR